MANNATGRAMRQWAGALMALMVLGCAGAGPYGHARTYVALPEEAGHAARAEEAVYDEVRRMPDGYQGRTLAFFGVVESVEAGEGGATRVSLQQRTHQERHLCEDDTERSCRVTVNARDGGPFTVVLTLRPADGTGEQRVQRGSLLRVFGTLEVGSYDAQGGPVLRGVWYRHWPRGEYVTTASAAVMRR